MFCPKCGLNQGERRFCTGCGTNLAAVSQSLHSQLPVNSTQTGPTHPVGMQFMPSPMTPYEMERQREYAKGMKMMLVGGAFLAFNILKFILSFGHSSFGFFGFVGLILFAVGLSKVLSWRQIAGTANSAVLQAVPAPEHRIMPPSPAPTPNTAQLNQPPKPVFSAVPPGTRTDELEPARLTNNATPTTTDFMPSVTEDDTRHLPNQQPNGQKPNWKME